MLMMVDMRLRDSHLTTTDTSTDIRHAVVVTDSLMLIIRVSFASLRSIPHNGILVLGILANQRAAARGGNHLVPVERQHAIFTEGT